MFNYNEHDYAPTFQAGSPCFLVGDIGGTNSNFGLGQWHDSRVQLIYSWHVKTATIVDFVMLVQDVITRIQQRYGCAPERACFAVAGPVLAKHKQATLTNAPLTIDVELICKHTTIKQAQLVNDFLVISYGIDLVATEDRVCVQQGEPDPYGNRVIVGAGTGLGVSLAQWIDALQCHQPLASEGGHMDFAAQDERDLQLINYMHATRTSPDTVSWEEILSGRGIATLYDFLQTTGVYAEQDRLLQATHGPHPDEIFAARVRDALAADTCNLYTQYYARCARNWALGGLATGGLYIVGGIAAHNVELFFTDMFTQTFIDGGKHAALLRTIPVWVIRDYNVSLYGALAYMMCHD